METSFPFFSHWGRERLTGETAPRRCCRHLAGSAFRRLFCRQDAGYVFSVVGTSRCDVRAACSGATSPNASVARIFVAPATTRAGTAQRAIPTIALTTYRTAAARQSGIPTEERRNGQNRLAQTQAAVFSVQINPNGMDA